MGIICGAMVFCEGKPSSLDFTVLDRLLTKKPVAIVPAGGKQGMRSFIDGRLSNTRDQPPYLAFRDRDFDRKPPQKPCLIPLTGKPIFLSFRACIENYLLSANLLDRYWRESARGPRWNYGPSPGVEEIDEWIKKSAQKIAVYQAVRWALATLKPGDR